MRLRSARGGRVCRRLRCRIDGSLLQLHDQHLSVPQPLPEPRSTARHRRAADQARERERPPFDARCLQAEPEGARGYGPNRLLLLPGRGSHGVSESPQRRVRRGAGWRRLGRCAAEKRELVPARGHALARWTLPRFRRPGRGYRLQQRSGNCRAQTAGRRAGPRGSHLRGYQRLRRQQRRLAQNRLHGSQCRRPDGGRRPRAENGGDRSRDDRLR